MSIVCITLSPLHQGPEDTIVGPAAASHLRAVMQTWKASWPRLSMRLAKRRVANDESLSLTSMSSDDGEARYLHPRITFGIGRTSDLDDAFRKWRHGMREVRHESEEIQRSMGITGKWRCCCDSHNPKTSFFQPFQLLRLLSPFNKS